MYSSPSTTAFNPNLNCDKCAGVGWVPIYKMSWRTEFCEVCPKCKGTGEAQTKETNE